MEWVNGSEVQNSTEPILVRRNNAVLISNRLSVVRLNETHTMFVLSPLMSSDDGDLLHCALADNLSKPVLLVIPHELL